MSSPEQMTAPNSLFVAPSAGQRLRWKQPNQSNATTRRLAIMNLAIRGITADFGPEHADTFRRDLHPDLHPDLRADYVLANPPFNDSDWFRKDDDVRWQFGVPPKGNANFAWVQHFIHHLAPQTALRDSAFLQSKASPQVVSEAKDNMAGFVLANGSMSSNQSGEGVTAGSVQCLIQTKPYERRPTKTPGVYPGRSYPDGQ